MSLLRSQTLAGHLARTIILWVGGIWIAGILAVGWYMGREIDFNFDNELVEVSHRLFDIALGQMDAAQSPGAAAEPVLIPAPSAFADASVPFQIVSLRGKVLARAADTPSSIFDVPVAPGFAETKAWRIYTVQHPHRGVYLQVADPLDERSDAVNRTLLGLIVPLTAVLPLIALMLLRIARSELRVLDGLAREISLRDGQLLHPIRLPDLPTELQSVSDHVNRLLERLAQALDVERALAANAAHELRTPLAAARLRLQTALDHGLPRGEVEAALSALQTLSHRTEKLLQLSRAESSMPFTRDRVDLVLLATTVAQEFWQEERAVDLLDLVAPDEPGGPPVALGDFDALAIAVRNLVENALRYAPDGPVELIVGPGCRIAVRDHGPGVPEHALQKLQQRHVRQSTQRVGYGLGLSIVSTIAQKHDAALVMESPPAGQTQGFEASLTLESAPEGSNPKLSKT